MDRFFRGILSGIAGGIAMNIWDYISYYILGLADLRYLDWGSVAVFGRLPTNILESITGQIAQLMWAGFLGLIFAYLIPIVTSRGVVIKGAFWGFITGFIQYAVAILVRMPHFTTLSTGTAISQLIGGIIWGSTMAYTLKLMDKTPNV